jgi:hypothetical protein
MERIVTSGTMPLMSTPTVIETPLRLEPVTADDFISDLTALSGEVEVRPPALEPRLRRLPVTA